MSYLNVIQQYNISLLPGETHFQSLIDLHTLLHLVTSNLSSIAKVTIARRLILAVHSLYGLAGSVSRLLVDHLFEKPSANSIPPLIHTYAHT